MRFPSYTTISHRKSSWAKQREARPLRELHYTLHYIQHPCNEHSSSQLYIPSCLHVFWDVENMHESNKPSPILEIVHPSRRAVVERVVRMEFNRGGRRKRQKRSRPRSLEAATIDSAGIEIQHAYCRVLSFSGDLCNVTRYGGPMHSFFVKRVVHLVTGAQAPYPSLLVPALLGRALRLDDVRSKRAARTIQTHTAKRPRSCCVLAPASL